MVNSSFLDLYLFKLIVVLYKQAVMRKLLFLDNIYYRYIASLQATN